MILSQYQRSICEGLNVVVYERRCWKHEEMQKDYKPKISTLMTRLVVILILCYKIITFFSLISHVEQEECNSKRECSHSKQRQVIKSQVTINTKSFEGGKPEQI